MGTVGFILLVLITMPSSTGQLDCLEQLQAPQYPTIGRTYAVQPRITVRFSVDEKGRVGPAQYENATPSLAYETLQMHSQFASALGASLKRTQLDPFCQGNYSLVYRFILGPERLSDDNATIKRSGPNELTVHANLEVITCSIYSVEQPRPMRRLLERIFHLRKRPTTIATECY